MAPSRRIAWAVAAAAGCVAGVLAFPAGLARGEPAIAIDVSDAQEIRAAAARATPGTHIRLAPGVYAGGIHLIGLRGEPDRPIVIEAQDATRPPVIEGGGSGLHLTDPVHVEVVGIHIRGQRGNGINVDDGGSFETPARHVTLRGLVVLDVGPDGNCDGIKLSGVEDFRVEACTVERWGSAGSAVDLVGCHRGTIERSVFRHRPGGATGSGVQLKGGTHEVAVRGNRFEHAGSRAINAGGSTGLDYFRPLLATWRGPKSEARSLVIEGNVIVGSDAAVAFVGVDRVTFRFNTILRPGRWALRILQETRAPDFVPSREVDVTDNLIVFMGSTWREGGVNVGAGTAPATFRFARNHWFAEDAPPRTRDWVRLPSAERDGTYGADPLLVDSASAERGVRPGSPSAAVGAHACCPSATPNAR